MGRAGAVYALLLVPVRSRPTPVTPATRPSAPITMWMPRSCTWHDMNAASTPY